MTAEKRKLYWVYFLLAARVLLAFILMTYGWSKLTGNQFGVNEKAMNTALKDLDLFRVSWYLADHEPFRSFIGVSQIITALLLICPRTVLLGAFMSIPIWLNILVWDISFMGGLANAFTVRLSVYLLLTGLILYQGKDRVIQALRSLLLTRSNSSVPVWAYLALPVAAISIELLTGLLNWAIASVRVLLA